MKIQSGVRLVVVAALVSELHDSAGTRRGPY
jgi:hypothetical protein